MRALRAWWRRLTGYIGSARRDAELAAEIESHLAMHADDNARAGLAPGEARRQAVLKLGGVAATTERYRDRRGVPLLDEAVGDVRYALRALRRSPAYAFTAVLTLALGIGAATAVFSIVNGVLLRPLPFEHPDDLFLVFQQDRLTKESFGDATPANFLDWRARNHSLTDLAAVRDEKVSLAFGEHPERVSGADVTWNFFDLLGVRAEIGRTFGEKDRAAARVAVIGDGLWRDQFGGRTDIVGRTLRINGEPHTVIGVLPAGIDYPDEAQVWFPPHWAVPDDPLARGRDPSPDRGHAYFYAIGRLRPGVTPSQARADLDALGAALAREYPDDNRDIGIGVRPLKEDLVGDTRPALLLLLAAVGLLLLIATVNVSGLLIARSAARRQEIAIRQALGASRGRIVRQLLVESTLLAVIAGGLGALAAAAATGALVATSPLSTGISRPATVDLRVLVFALGISTAVGIVCGLIPAAQGTASDVEAELKRSARAGGGPSRRLRSALVSIEVALSVVLLVAAGLTIRSLAALRRVHTGFESAAVLTLQLNASEAKYATPQQQADFWSRAREALGEVPGVVDAGAISRLPLTGGNSIRGITIDGRPVTPPAEADYRSVMPDYFGALHVTVLRGRSLEDADRAGRPLVGVISESAARRYFAGVDPIGHHVTIEAEPITIVGVVGDVRHALQVSPRPTLYVPYQQDPWPFMTFVLKTRGRPEALVSAVRAAIWRVDPDQAVSAVMTMDDRVHASTSERQFTVGLFAAFGGAALLLAAVGLYGVLAFLVAERRREIGVRMALGAARREIVRAVVSDGVRLAAAGLIVGLPAAFVAARLMKALLFETSAADAPTFAAACAVLLAVAVAASALPAFRASRVDPAAALRTD